MMHEDCHHLFALMTISRSNDIIFPSELKLDMKSLNKPKNEWKKKQSTCLCTDLLPKFLHLLIYYSLERNGTQGPKRWL